MFISINPRLKLPKTLVVELRSSIQSLLQKVTQLEKNNASHVQDSSKLKSSFKSHATGYEKFHKLTNTRLKSLQGLDYTEDLEVSKISNLCSGIQKQIGDLRNVNSAPLRVPLVPNLRQRVLQRSASPE